MAWELIVGITTGIALALTGLIPFLHANTVIELTESFFHGTESLQWFAVILVFSRLPFEFIASAKLVSMREDTALSMHPFQKMAQAGQSSKAVQIALYHCAAGILIALLSFPLVSLFAPFASRALQPFVGIIVAAIFAIFILMNKNKLDATLLAALAGALGIIVLEKNLAGNSLFFLLSGLFAVPVLLEEVKAVATEKENKPTNLPQTQSTASTFNPLLGIAGGIIALAASFFPAISLTVLTALAFTFMERGKEEHFIALNTAIVGGRAVSDFAALNYLGKARSGAAAAIMENSTSYAFTTALFQIAFASVVFLILALIAMHLFNSISFSWLEKKTVRAAVVLLLFSYAFLSDGAGGLIVLSVASLVGLTALQFQCGRAVLSSCIVFPAVKNTLPRF